MTTRIWNGGTDIWTDANAWVGSVVPLLQDTAVVNSGIVGFTQGETLAAAIIDLGSAALSLDDALLGSATTINSTAAGVQSLLLAASPAAFDGTLNATASGGSLTISAQNDGLTLLDGASIADSGGDVMTLDGTLYNQASINIGSSGDFVNDGTIVQDSAALQVLSGGTIGGTGTIEIGLFSSFYLEAGSAPSSEDVVFTDVGGRLRLGDPGSYTGVVHNFQTGDLIDLTTATANAASYNAATGLLSVTDDGSVIATLTLDAPAGTSFFTTSDGAGGTYVALDGSAARVNYLIDGPDRAMGADVVRSTMTSPGGAKLTGSGVRIGIISDSFDASPGAGTADVANAAAAAGFLPANPGGTSAVTVLSDAVGSGDDNEGLAMAELVHQVAPGASIDFATGSGDDGTLASAVTSLQQAGCNIIVDDLYEFDEPFFQNAGTIDTAIDNAVSAGVNYFTATGNTGSQAYQSTFDGTLQDLGDGIVGAAQTFDNGTPYQTLTLNGGVEAIIDLQWVATGLLPGEKLQMALFNAAGQVVASFPYYASTDEIGDAQLSYTPSTTGDYKLAIYGTVPTGTEFKYILFGSEGGGSTTGGVIDDPAANASTVMGHAMLPDVTAVGAVDFPQTPAFDSSGNGYASYYSSTGNPEFLLDSSGDSLPAPQVIDKPNILAPVDAGTSVTGFSPFDGTSAAAPEAAAVAALMLQANPSLTPAQVQSDLEASANSIGQPASVQGAGVVNALGAVDLALGLPVACFAEGTRITTDRGCIAVQNLRVGDNIVASVGGLRPVQWLGHRRVDCARHPRPCDVWPVRVRADAVAPRQPARDLLLSPDHAVFLDGVLIPVRYLVNGASIAQMPIDALTYWHVELPMHDVLWAEGLPCETYLDTGNRAAFAVADRVAAQSVSPGMTAPFRSPENSKRTRRAA